MKRLRPRGFRSEHTGREREITGNNREAEREREKGLRREHFKAASF